jgi:hypothetical protein
MPLLVAAVASCFALTMSGCGSVTLLSAVSSPVRLLASQTCPSALGAKNGVANPYAGDELVAPNPTFGLICRYTPPYPLGPQPNTNPASLYADARLTASQAEHLVRVIDSISTAHTTGSSSCPGDDGSTSVIAFAYTDAPDIDLWFKDSGCQTLDNGRLRAFETANPNFYGAFDTLIENWAPARS